MSPWMPPTYVWAVAEGIFGIEPQGNLPPKVSLCLPQAWSWVSAFHVPIGAGSLSFVYYDNTLYSTGKLQSHVNVVEGCTDVTESFRCNIEMGALETPEGTVYLSLFTRRSAGTTPVTVKRGETVWFAGEVPADAGAMLIFTKDGKRIGGDMPSQAQEATTP